MRCLLQRDFNKTGGKKADLSAGTAVWSKGRQGWVRDQRARRDEITAGRLFEIRCSCWQQ